MPTYDYKCNKCNYELEIFHSIVDNAKTLCPECDTHSLDRLISRNVGISFKGTGFYVNDSSSSTTTSSAKS
jgi:putative FmdB family regulatory protein